MERPYFCLPFSLFSVKRPCHVAAATERQGRITGSASYASAHQTRPRHHTHQAHQVLIWPYRPPTMDITPSSPFWTNMPTPHVIEQWARHIWSFPTPGTSVIVPHNNSQHPSMIFLFCSLALTDYTPGPACPLLCFRSVLSGP